MGQKKQICLTCASEFDDGVTACPNDGSKLKSVGDDPLVGTIFAGKYEFISLVGSGGMSSVYKARHMLLGKLCAVKLLHSQYSSKPERILRFQQEARAIAALSHPNIISVHEFAIAESGEPFLEMDLLEGLSLQDVIDRDGHISIEELVPIFRQVLDGLSHAHQLGIIHRDLKPSNIMLVGERPCATAKLVDFGIAKLMSDEDSGGQKLTKTGELFGSPFYMSPEQCIGDGMDARSDIYSLGCVMFECLTGNPPFKGDSVFKTLNMHVGAPVPKMNDTEHPFAVPDAFEELVQKAMSKDPKRRFQTVDEFKQGLEKAVLFSGKSPLPAKLRRGLAKLLSDDPKKPLRQRILRVLCTTAICVVTAAIFVILFSPSDCRHLYGLVVWRIHESRGSGHLEEARNLEKRGENKKADLELSVAENELKQAAAMAESYSIRQYPFSRWMRYTTYQHFAQVYTEMGKNDLAEAAMEKANQLYMEPITPATRRR